MMAAKINSTAKPELTSNLLESIYRQYHKNVYNYIAFRINNHSDVEELASQVFEKAIEKWAKYNPALPIEAWLIGIAKNTCTDHLRVTRRRTFVGLDKLTNLASPAKKPEELVIFNENNRALMAAMAKLKNRERQILSMKFATDLKHHEIAEIMGFTESHVGVIVHRALGKLRKLMEGEV